jgi:hypothetical protein
MKKSVMLPLAFLVVLGLLLMPAISGADPGNGNGNEGGNGRHYGWDKDNDNGNSSAQQIPEPFTLLLLGSGLVGLAVIRNRFR